MKMGLHSRTIRKDKLLELSDGKNCVPHVWRQLRCVGTIERNKRLLTLSKKDPSKQETSILHGLDVGDKIVIGNEEQEFLIESIDRYVFESNLSYSTFLLTHHELLVLNSNIVTLNADWKGVSVDRKCIFVWDEASRKQPYIELLIGQLGVRSVHEAGFKCVQMAMTGQEVTCPVCQEAVTRPTMTPCVHMYCFDCIARALDSPSDWHDVQRYKCQLCRRVMTPQQIFEMVLPEVTIEVPRDHSDVEDEQGGNAKDVMNEVSAEPVVRSKHEVSCNSSLSTSEITFLQSATSNEYVVPDVELNMSRCQELMKAFDKLVLPPPSILHEYLDRAYPALDDSLLYHVKRASTDAKGSTNRYCSNRHNFESSPSPSPFPSPSPSPIYVKGSAKFQAVLEDIRSTMAADRLANSWFSRNYFQKY